MLLISDPPDKPEIKIIEKRANLVEGDTIRLQCESRNGNPLPTLKWYKGYDRENELISKYSKYNSFVSSILVIQVKAQDNGALFRCESSNRACIEPLNAHTSFNVIFMTSFLKIHSEPQHPKQGSQVKLVCETGSCNPACDIRWIINNDSMIDQVKEEFDGLNNGKNTRSYVIIIANSKQDYSNVICQAYNKHLDRVVEKQYTLRVLRKYFTFYISRLITLKENLIKH